jgi:hypothetical protein
MTEEKYIHSIMYDDELINILDENEIDYVIKPVVKALYYDEELHYLTTRYIDCVFLTDEGLEKLEEILKEKNNDNL